MPFGHHTPESLLPRSDSKNPATTCRGLTSNGRPCRRTLAQSPRSSPAASPQRENGVVAVLESSGGQNPAAFFCWQHKDQVEGLAAKNKQTRLVTLQERTSIDTLVDQIGVVNLDEDVKSRSSRRHPRRRKEEKPLKKRDTLPPGWHTMETPLMSVPATALGQRTRPSQQVGRSNVKASFLCCLRADDDDLPPPRSHVNQQMSSEPITGAPLTPTENGSRYVAKSSKPILNQRPLGASTVVQRPPVTSSQSSPAPYPTIPPLTAHLTSKVAPGSHSSPNLNATESLLSLIPKTLSPATTSSLLAELSKPISPADEGGYIYIFWLTPESAASKPDDDTASTLLDSDPIDTPERARCRNDALQRYASRRQLSQPSSMPRQQQQSERTILLKIGRAANVHRRLSQWTKQCGHNINLIRYYPYSPSSTPSAVPSSSRKVPHVHRVERLIHIEMAERRVYSGLCEACGREHREWFEIEATRSGLRMVDECVKRWVAWAETAR